MMFKMTMLKSSSIRRLLSIVLAVTLVIGLLPVSTFATTGTGSTASVEYNRSSPEVAILNYYTGNNAPLYNQLKSEAISTDFGRYNAFDNLFGVNGTLTDTQGYDWKENWNGNGTYANSVLRELSKAYGNLEVNLSATFYNRTHSHTHAKGLKKYKYEITSYEKVYLQIGSSSPVIIAGVYPKENKDLTYPRVGDYNGLSNANLSSDAKNKTDSYGMVRYSENDTTFKVNFIGMDIGYYHFGDFKTCTCHGTYAENLLMTFRDTRAPQLAGVYYSLDNGTTWTSSADGLRVKAGSTLLIKLSYDEPIRFADDSAAGKGDLYLELQADGTSTGSDRKAYLTKLDGNDLYFSYTFDTPDANWKIQTLNTAALFGTALSLKQVYKNRSFTLNSSLVPSDTTGFTTTTCYITDLAGNALKTSSVSAGNLILDSETPYVKNVQFNLALNNADVKEALGKDKLDPESTTYKTDYADDSDSHLGVGDTVSMVINMNERLANSTLTDCTAVATTNILDENKAYVTVESKYYLPEAERLSGDITSWVMKPITLEAGWSVDDSKNEIKVTALKLTGGGTEITDLAGNPLDKNNVTIKPDANANPPVLDVTAPVVAEISDSYTTETDDGFRYGVSISDAESEFAGIYGSFILTNGGDGKNYQYEWTVTAEAATTGDTSWDTGTTGVAQYFVQHQNSYIHIRPKADETYGDLSGCTLTVKAKDYAGNESSALILPPSGTLGWYIDNLPPTVKAGDTERRLNEGTNAGGTLTAQVTLTDSKGISAWQYGWSDSAETEPTSWTAGTVTATTGSDPVTVTASAGVTDKTLFSQYLWVKATDNSGSDNTATVCLGQYTYDLRGAQYALDYASGITNWASMKVPSLGTTDSLFFLVKGKTGSEYALLRLDGSPYYKETNIFDRANTSLNWSYSYTFNEQDGLYTLTKTEDTEVQNTLQTTINAVKNGTYMGELNVVILSGPQGSVAGAVGDATLTLGDASYHFSQDSVTLKITGVRQNNYGEITFTSDSDPGSPYRSSLAGMEFEISIAQDLNGWNYADVNWTESYVELKKNVQGEDIVSYQFYLKPGPIADNGSTTQTLTIPEDDYVNGIYYATLYLKCYAGQNYERRFTKDGSIEGDSVFISVDTTEPNSDFFLESLTYAPNEGWSNKYGIADFYGTRDCLNDVGEDGVIILPVAAGDTFGTGDPAQSYQFTISSPTEKAAAGLYGRYELQMWNNADDTNKLTIDPTDDSQQTVKNYISAFDKYGFVFDETKADDHNLYLKPDVVNIVAIQKVYSNGGKSEIKYVYIQPVTGYITGEVSVDNNTRELVFTPDDPTATVGAKIYAWAWQDGQTPLYGEGQRIDMSPASDGTWRCNLVENGAKYKVITENSAGSICDAGDITELAPGVSVSEFTDNGDGTYKLRFAVSDDYDTMQNGLKLDISFNEAYSTDHLSFTIKEGSGLWTEDWTPDHNVYEWTETGVSTTGIYSVSVVKYSDYNNIKDWDDLGVTVVGCFAPNQNADQAMTDPQTMQVTLTATDVLGHTSSASTGEQTVAYQQPVIYVSGDNCPKLGFDGLVLTFSQPVQPVNSWAWQEADSDVKGFHTQWEGAFPIAGNGTYELQFVDMFGNTCSQELTTDAFTVNGKDYSMSVAFSSTAPNVESLAVTAACTNGYLTFWSGDGSGTIWKQDGAYDTYRLLDKEGGTWWPDSSIPRPGYPDQKVPEAALKDFGTVWREIRWYTNDKMKIRCGNSYWEGSSVYTQTVYITSIAEKTAPTADVRYYVYDLGKELSQAELEQYIEANGGSVTVTGNVQVWYKTTRSVTPTEGGSEYLFTPENYQDGHTFAYVDDAGNTASVTVTLPAGLTLAAPAEPPVDNTAPIVNIDIYTKSNDSYTRAESFKPGDQDITNKFTALGNVQGYSLTVNATDASGYDIAVSGEGAALSGNIVTITKAGTFTVTVTDRSTNKNATSVTFTVPALIDSTKPTAEISIDGEHSSLYQKALIITLADKDDAGNDTGTVTLSLPADAVPDANDANKYTYQVTDNGTVEFVFFDQVGNRGLKQYKITNIDTEPPELTVEWSPPLVYEDWEGNTQVDRSWPTQGPVNTNVTARIKSDKAMYNLTVQTGGGSPQTLLDKGVTQPCSISESVTLTATPELVTVTFSEDYYDSLTFTATAPNGKSTTLTLYGLYNVIDKIPPAIDITQEPKMLTGYSVPYEVEVTLRPTKESVTSPNYGATDNEKQPVEYNFDNPLVLTFTEDGTYNVRFVDAAGNVTIVPVVITGIDRTAPKLTVGTPVDSGQTAKVRVTVDEACTLTWGENGMYTFNAAGSDTIVLNQNGTFAITATDAAGNKSFKMVRVGSIDDIVPSISFTSSTIYVMEDETDLDAKLNEGFEYSDNMTAKNDLTVNIVKPEELNTAGQYTAGQYTVTYTVTDEAGNTTTANRFVRVIGSDTVCLNIDGKLILPDSTAVLSRGGHTLTLENNSEPYSIKARKGILSAGQMKYLSGSSLSFDENGRFNVTATGYYTLLVTTQSRQTIRILLYVEQ